MNKVEVISEFIAIFIVNFVIFLLAKFFTEISIIQCFLYSIINSIWMMFLLLPLLKKTEKKRNNESFKKGIQDYVSKFEENQKIINQKFEEEDKEIEKLNRINKYDWKLFRKYLRDNGITKLYHFTDKSNLNSIKSNGGIFSWKYCDENNIIINKPGGNQLSRDLDSRKNLENYARLSFVKEHPMLFNAINDGRITNPIILEIDIEVIFLKETLFSNKNANSNNAKIGKDFVSLADINLKIINEDYKSLSESIKEYFQSEVLIKEKIDIKYITNLP
ncbi:DUF4433 domain-containing protein [Empedobacter sp. 225-1]|uniref:DarT ssDNA thymidine ADP-ribosyltransferase family protein n=1 Tax=unclassified Empedobacter TaxID=2643773 RepID=UPI0025752EEE|nr:MULTISPECIES: DarT ssDNA thymidine ADP-ribosyltransferase family protein [unclassified Empedobacter]MDM1524279.1 DUF4433 domain-containing protein [Empedobacter sp. 225-1]MDM1544230.1 DUF4433 domain-containing protein [Empedobacter sp. 189-2]